MVRRTLVHFEVRGAKNDLGRFCGMGNFQDECLNMKIILRAKRQKQKDAMFSLSRRSIFSNSELGSQTYEIEIFSSSNAKYCPIDKMDGILVPKESFK